SHRSLVLPRSPALPGRAAFHCVRSLLIHTDGYATGERDAMHRSLLSRRDVSGAKVGRRTIVPERDAPWLPSESTRELRPGHVFSQQGNDVGALAARQLDDLAGRVDVNDPFARLRMHPHDRVDAPKSLRVRLARCLQKIIAQAGIRAGL